MDSASSKGVIDSETQKVIESVKAGQKEIRERCEQLAERLTVLETIHKQLRLDKEETEQRFLRYEQAKAELRADGYDVD